MAEVSKTLEAVQKQVEETLKCNAYVVDTLPTTFVLGNAYILAPENVSVNHMMTSGSLQEFEIEIIVPAQESNSDRLQTLAKSVMKSLENINTMLYSTFNRTRNIGDACISSVNYKVQNWEVQGYIYTSADVTLHFKSLLPY